MTFKIIALAAVAALGLLAPAAAQASLTVTGQYTMVVAETSPAADNLAVSRSGSTVSLVQTAGGTIQTPGPYCTNINPARVDCPVPNQFEFNVGDGNDVVTMTGDAVWERTDALLYSATFRGGPGNDVLTGSPQKDTFIGGPGADTFSGRQKVAARYEVRDIVDYAEKGSTPVRVSVDGFANDGTAGEGDNVGEDVEEIHGTSGADTLSAPSPASPFISLWGEDGDDTLQGGPRADYLPGGAGNDAIDGGAGDDELRGAEGDDRLTGGEGDDYLYNDGLPQGNDELRGGPGDDYADVGRYSGAPDYAPVPVSVTLDDAANDGQAGEADNVQSDVERLEGGDGDDRLVGSDASNALEGRDGDDTLDGRGGLDVLNGEYGTDRVLARDGVLDRVNCGAATPGKPDADSAEVDDVDTVFSCESLAVVPIMRIVPSTPGTPAPPQPDRAAPDVSIAGLAGQATREAFRKDGLKFRVAVSEPAALDVKLLARVRRSGRKLAFSAAAGELEIGSRALARAGGTRPVALTPSGTFARAVRNRKLRLTVRISATDAAGNARVVTRVVRVK